MAAGNIGLGSEADILYTKCLAGQQLPLGDFGWRIFYRQTRRRQIAIRHWLPRRTIPHSRLIAVQAHGTDTQRDNDRAGDLPGIIRSGSGYMYRS